MDLIERFAAEYHDYHGISADRRREQIKVLRALEALAGRPLSAIESSDLSRYFQAMISDGYKPTTVRKHRGLIAPWLTWARDQGIITPTTFYACKDVRLPRGAVNSSTPNPYTRSEIRQLWRDVANDYPWARNETGKKFRTEAEQLERADYYLRRWRAGSSSYRRVRAYAHRLQIEAIIAICLCGGLRRDECFALTLDNMDPANAYLVAIGAAKNPEAEMLRAGYPLHEVQRILGHSRLQQTLEYAQLLPDDVVQTALKQREKLSGVLLPHNQRPEAEADEAA
jgi:integrase